MFLLAGIGNIGEKYDFTRHNIGFLIIDEIISQYDLKKEKDNFDSLIYKGLIFKKKVLLAKPLTFVNNSGKAISKIVSFYKIPIEKIFVFHDDMDLNISRIKIKVGGSDAGHNGIKSIDMNIGKNYNRIRVGIGNSKKLLNARSHVLERFSKTEYEILKPKISMLAKNIDILLSYESDNLLNILANV